MAQRRRTGRLAAYLCAVALALTPLATHAGGAIKRTAAATGTIDRQAKEAELAKLRERIGALRAELGQVRSKYDQLREDLHSAEQTIAQLSVSLRQVQSKLADQLRKLDALKGRRTELEGSVALQRRYLTEQIRAAYVMGRQEYLKILLNQQDPVALSRTLTYYDYLNRARSDRITSLLDTMRQLEQVRQDIEQESTHLAALRDQQRAQKSELEQSVGSRKQLMVQLRQELATKDRRLKQLLADEKELESVIAAVVQALEDIPAEPGNHRPFDKQRGKLPWPASGPIIERYGAPRLGKLQWQGVLIGAAEGQPVRAVSYGRVAFADWLRGYGYLMIIDHGDGYMSLYGYNQSLQKEVGDWVEAGDVIAIVGSSGGNERAALYFEIRHDGKTANPTKWCRR